MTSVDTTFFELLAVCADIAEWSQRAGLPGDYVAFWQKHDVVLKRINGPASRHGPGAAERLRQTELETWIEILRRSLRPEALDRVATAFASNGGATLWVGLAPERRQQVMRRRQAHVRSVEQSFTAALLRFRASPSCRRVAAALRTLEDLVRTTSPPSEGWTSEQLRVGLEWMIDAVLRVIPPVAREILAEEVEEAFSSRVDPA